MQKTKLGISVGLLGALLFFSGLFGGYIITIILAGYILLFEENAWLKKAGVKAVALMVGFSILSALVGLIPDFLGIINDICAIFGGYFSIAVINSIVTALLSIIAFAKTILFLILGIKAFGQSSIRIPLIDNLIQKYMD